MQRLKLKITMLLPSSPSNHSFSTSSSSSTVSPWPGLRSWRDTPLNHNRNWGPHGPEPELESKLHDSPFGQASSLAESHLSHLAFSLYRRHNLPLGLSQPPSSPARPQNPQLVSTKEIPAPKNSGLPLNAYLLHNLAHVELNAIDLAWDTVVRFSPYSDVLGEGFFADFARVADDESRHFSWCSQRLAELGFKYGDMPAHNLLWRECEKSSDNVAARLAVIPLVQEARGLDAGPRLVQKLVGFGDNRTSKIVARIAEEEVAHVAVGLYWFLSVCQKMGCAPDSTFKDLLKEYNVELKGPSIMRHEKKLAFPVIGMMHHQQAPRARNTHMTIKNSSLKFMRGSLPSLQWKERIQV